MHVSTGRKIRLLSRVHRTNPTHVTIVLFPLFLHGGCETHRVCQQCCEEQHSPCRHTERCSEMTSSTDTTGRRHVDLEDIQVAAAWTSLNSTPPNNNHEVMTLLGLLSKGRGDYIHHPVGHPLPKQGHLFFVFSQCQIYS